MKFKVGDKVKVKKNFKCRGKMVYPEMRALEGQEVTITEITISPSASDRIIKIDKSAWYWTEDDFELINNNFTKSDLKDGDIVTYRNGDKRTKIGDKLFNENGIGTMWLHSYNEDLTREYKERKETDIIKVERPTGYATVFERKEEILNEVEKEYLRDVIRPFRKDIDNIVKVEGSQKEHLTIHFKDADYMMFKSFYRNRMYKGMKAGKEYTLEELGL